MSRSNVDRLTDVIVACAAIEEYLSRYDEAEPLDGLVVDALRMRLLEIGGAVKALPRHLLVSEPDVPWQEIVRMRDLLAHRYFDTNHAIVTATARRRVPVLRAAAERLLAAT